MKLPTMTIKSTLYRLAFASMLCISMPAWCADDADQNQNPVVQTTVMSKIQEIKDRATQLVATAGDFIGTRYKRGGNTVSQGLDCSGLVRLVFKDALNVNLPRTAAEISRAGEKIDQSELQPGDLVFYNTLKRGFSHVGIYLGDNKFIHSPSAGGQVRIESMELGYWKKRFNGARRINDDAPSH